MKSSRRIDCCRIRNHSRKPSRFTPGNHHRNPVLQLRLKSSALLDSCRIRNHWQKLSR
jgi:hypothetical protein